MRDPDRVDPTGTIRVWRLRAPDPPLKPDHAAGLCSWIINGPFHPFWNWWAMAVISLRDIEGVPPADRHYPEAEYELSIISLNPEVGPPDVDAIEAGSVGYSFLTPPDVVKQFHGISEQDAIRVGEFAVAAIVAGDMSPDSDFRSRWEASIDLTVEHFAVGMHQEPVM